METFFKNSKNSKTNEPNRKIGKMLNQFITIISLKYQH